MFYKIFSFFILSIAYLNSYADLKLPSDNSIIIGKIQFTTCAEFYTTNKDVVWCLDGSKDTKKKIANDDASIRTFKIDTKGLIFIDTVSEDPIYEDGKFDYWYIKTLYTRVIKDFSTFTLFPNNRFVTSILVYSYKSDFFSKYNEKNLLVKIGTNVHCTLIKYVIDYYGRIESGELIVDYLTVKKEKYFSSRPYTRLYKSNEINDIYKQNANFCSIVDNELYLETYNKSIEFYSFNEGLKPKANIVERIELY